MANKHIREKSVHIRSASIREVEMKHQQELQELDEKIEKKREALEYKILQDHIEQKKKLKRAIKSLETEIEGDNTRFRNQQQHMRAENSSLQQKQKESLSNHEQEVENMVTEQDYTINTLVSQITMIQDELFGLGPEAAKLTGKISALYKSSVKDSSRTLLEIMVNFVDKKRKQMLTEKAEFHRERRELQQDIQDKTRVLQETMAELDGELKEANLRLHDDDEPYNERITALKKEVEHPPFVKSVHEEIMALENEVEILETRYIVSREEAEQIAMHELRRIAEVKSNEWREKLQQQKTELFAGRTEMKQKLLKVTKQFQGLLHIQNRLTQDFEHKLQSWEENYNDEVAYHEDLLREIKRHHKEALKNINRFTEEQEKCLLARLDQLEKKEKQLINNHDSIHSELQGRIDSTNDVIAVLTTELQKVDDGLSQELQKMEQDIGSLKRQAHMAEANKEKLAKESQRELSIILNINGKLQMQLPEQEKEIALLQQNIMDIDKKLKNSDEENALNAATAKQREDINKLQYKIASLLRKVQALDQKQRFDHAEREAEIDGMKEIIKTGEQFLENERVRLHGMMDDERQRYNDDIRKFHAQIEEASEQREALTENLRREIEAFTVKSSGACGCPTTCHDDFVAGLHRKLDLLMLEVDKIEKRIGSLVAEHKTSMDAKQKESDLHLHKLKQGSCELQKKIAHKSKILQEGKRMYQFFVNEVPSEQSEDRELEVLQGSLLQLNRKNKQLAKNIGILEKKTLDYEQLSSKEMQHLKKLLNTLASSRRNKKSKEEKGIERQAFLIQRDNNNLKMYLTNLSNKSN